MISEPHGIYRHGCINCSGEISDLRLSYMLPCEKCLPIRVEDLIKAMPSPTHTDIIKLTEKLGTLKKLRKLKYIISEVNEFHRLFEKLIGNKMWSAQETWAKRVLKKESFSIVAPTGVGKTVFGIVASIYFARKNLKSYIIVPTTPLVLQVHGKLVEFVKKLNKPINVIAYHAKLGSKEKKKTLEDIANGNFHILVTTSKFLSARFDILKDNRFYFIFVDDVDAILKSSKNIDYVLMLLGFTEEEIQTAYEFIKLKRKLAQPSLSEKERSMLLKNIMKKQKLIERFSRRVKGVLIVSSATGRPRGLRVKLFRELLGFEVGTRSEYLRAIIDTYLKPENSIEEEVAKLVNLLGKGGLIFVPIDKGVEYAKTLVEFLQKKGIKAKMFISKEIKALEEFINGEVDVLVGVATYYGVMVRGLDLPEIIRYAIFAGIPRFKFSTKLDEPHPLNIMRALVILREILEKDEKKEKIDKLIVKMKKYLTIAPAAALSEIAKKLKENIPPETVAEKIFYEALSLARLLLEKTEIKRKLKELKEVAIVEENGRMYILIPDIMTYIQASGRTSRMFVGGITKGLSIVIVDDERLLYGLLRRTKWFIEDMAWIDLKTVDLKAVMKEIDEDRELVRAVREGKVKLERVKEWFKTILLVVESPNKARTIANFFGKPTIRRSNGLKVYEVTTGKYLLMITATGGHVFDLTTSQGFHGVLTPKDNYVNKYLPVYDTLKRCLNCGYQFTEYIMERKKLCPKCGSSNIRDSLNVINFIKELAEEVDLVLIGTDPDTEGEKIGWDIAVHLRPHAKKLLRVEFHEVTKRAIAEALDSPREFNANLIKAQVVRRIEDRWIGFELSRRLWNVFGMHWLSAGRVQTPVLGWIIDRYVKWSRERKTVYIIRIKDLLTVEIFEDEIPKEYRISEGRTEIDVLEEKTLEESLPPLPPFTTDTLLTEASKMLRLSASKTMELAQDLFELGFITYHRTDSPRVSLYGQNIARTYLTDVYGEKAKDYFKPRGWAVGGAHECIRPTRPIDADRLVKLISEGIITPIKPLTKDHILLYDLIFRRFIASQMKEAKVLKQKLKIKVMGVVKEPERVIAIKDKGFLEFYNIVHIEPKIEKGKYISEEIKIEKRPLTYLFTHGDLVKQMKDKGIGRPSTYAKIINTLLQRKYVIEKKKRLIPTDLGIKVYTYLLQNYSRLVSEERTAMLEELMDEIERGEKNYLDVLDELYDEITSLP
ncbi:MAG: reverse gyrase [Thermoprotei archaeon]|nr:MAG: reverse gyrase [Thermoprotei archaeon]